MLEIFKIILNTSLPTKYILQRADGTEVAVANKDLKPALV
jgi:hypothetical protein